MLTLYKLGDRYKVVQTFQSVNAERQPKKKTSVKRVAGSSQSENSLISARSRIREYVDCNNFNYFITFTFSERNFNRHNLEENRYFITNYLTRYFRGYKYVLVPELHEDGALHFHGFINIPCSELTFCGSKRLKSGRYIPRYFSKQFNADIGRNVLEPIECNKRYQINYVLKYITKSMQEQLPFSNYYFNSRGLAKKEKLEVMDVKKEVAFLTFASLNNLRSFDTDFCCVWWLSESDYAEFLSKMWFYEFFNAPFQEMPKKIFKQISIFS